MKRRLGFGGLGAWAAAMGMAWACLGGCIGGTGSDHENGIAIPDDVLNIRGVSARVVDSVGLPIAGVTLRLYDPAFRPDLNPVPPSLLTDTARVPVTDSRGFAELDLVAPGIFVVEGVSAGKTLFFDTLAAPVLDKATPFTFRIRAAAAFRGKVSLFSGMRIDSGSVFIRGTSRTAALDAAGNYDLGSLPSDAGRMGVGIRYASSPTSVQKSRQNTLDSGYSGPVTQLPQYTCKDVVAKESKVNILTSAARAPEADTAASAKAAVDSTQVGRALMACDSLPRGGVVGVVSQDSAGPAAQKRDSTTVSMLVLTDEKVEVSFIGVKVVPATVIPYAGCVPAAGTETTSFELKLQATAVKSDILVGDVAAKCLEK